MNRWITKSCRSPPFECILHLNHSDCCLTDHLHHVSLQFLDEADRSLHDAIMIVRRALKNSNVVAGGGAIDMELSKALRWWQQRSSSATCCTCCTCTSFLVHATTVHALQKPSCRQTHFVLSGLMVNTFCRLARAGSTRARYRASRRCLSTPTRVPWRSSPGSCATTRASTPRMCCRACATSTRRARTAASSSASTSAQVCASAAD